MERIEASDIRHMGTGATLGRYARLARDYMTSAYRSRAEREQFQSVTAYCMFVGHARSGHSIVGALLDAHPNVILPDEVDALRYLAAGFRREQLFHILIARSRRQARKGRTKAGRNGKQYSYFVPGQWQGRFSTLRVIGDSKAGKSTQRLAEDPALLARLEAGMGSIAVKLIHVVRNPYDNISTMMLRGGRSFESAFAQYFANCSALAQLRGRIESRNLLTLKQEQLILQPQTTLRELCAFLAIPAPEDYVAACASILYTSVPRSRSGVPWDAAAVAQIAREIERFPFLAGYTFADEAAAGSAIAVGDGKGL